MTKLLRPLGFDVQELDGGLTALEGWDEFRPKFVWRDLHMPDMDGHGTAERIRELEHAAGAGEGSPGWGYRDFDLSPENSTRGRFFRYLR